MPTLKTCLKYYDTPCLGPEHVTSVGTEYLNINVQGKILTMAFHQGVNKVTSVHQETYKIFCDHG